MYVDDMADACVFLMENYEGQEHLNIGTGEEISIRGLAELIQDHQDALGLVSAANGLVAFSNHVYGIVPHFGFLGSSLKSL